MPDPALTLHRHPVRRRARLSPVVRLGPGVGLSLAVGLAAMLAAQLVPIPAATFAVVAGAIMVNSGRWCEPVLPGAAWTAKHLLRVAVVLLGLQLSLTQLAQLGLPGLLVIAATVTVTFVGTQLLARWLGVSREQGLLVATGFAICGASAVGAMAQTTDADEDDQAVAVALVTLCGTCAIVALPLLNLVLGMPPEVFGRWVGASVQDVGQTVAAAQQLPGALQAAVVVKLSRVVLLAPLVAGVAIWLRLRARREAAAETAGATGPVGVAKRPPLVPWFVVGFLVMVGVGTWGALPVVVTEWLHRGQELLLTAALFGLGAGIRLSVLRRTGPRALALGGISWVLVAAVALLVVYLGSTDWG